VWRKGGRDVGDTVCLLEGTERTGESMKTFLSFAVFLILVQLAFWGTIVFMYVAYHFLSKVW
jgi:hypothetical protein